MGKLFKIFRNSENDREVGKVHPLAQRFTRRSSGIAEFTRRIAGQQGLRVLELGATSATNITLFTEMGHGIYTADLLLASQDPALIVRGDNGDSTLDVNRFLDENLSPGGPVFDAVLCWDVADYLPEVLVKPVIGRIGTLMKPGGILLAFFHTRDAGLDSPYCHYHLTAGDVLEVQPVRARSGSAAFRLQRVFNNRHIENLFREFAALKFFLARDNVREVLVTR